MLLDRMTKARCALLERQSADLSQSVVQWHVDATAELRNQANRMMELAVAAQSLRAAGIVRDLGTRPFKSLRLELAEAEKIIGEAGDARPTVKFPPQDRTSSAKDIADSAVRRAWLAYIDQAGVAPASEEVQKLLRQIGLSAVADALGHASKQLRQMRATLPRTAADIESVSAARLAVEAAWRKASITPEMVPQVTMLTGSGLPLSGASDELLRWLKDRKLDSQVRLRLS
jgi:hypothetical protein